MKVYRSRRWWRWTTGVLFVAATTLYIVPSYHPLLGDATLRSAYAAIERDDMKDARTLLADAIHHLEKVAASTEDPGLWATVVGRFLDSWGGRPAVLSALGTAHFLLGDCVKALPFLEREVAKGPSPSRTALLSYRLAVCHADKERPDDAEEALLRALLIDRRYAQKAKSDPRLRPLAEGLLSKRL